MSVAYTYTGPPPLMGYYEDPPGSGHWVPDPGSEISGGGSIGGGGGTVANIPVTVAPKAAFSYTVYAGGLVGFIDNSVGLIGARLWSFGDGHNGVQSSALHQYLTTGTFTVTLTVANSRGQDTVTQNVVIPAAAIATVIDFSYVISGLGVQFTDISTKAGDRNWDFGDGSVSNEVSPYHLYGSAGIYTVSLDIGGSLTYHQIPIDYGILLQWQDNSGDETGFKIERSPNGSTEWTLIATVGAGVETLTVTKNLHGVDPAVENHFRVYAYNDGGTSDYSNSVETLCEA